MTHLTPFEKRLKRHVVAKPVEFFAATTPGLELLCLKEMRKLSLNTSNKCVTTGGVSFTGQLQDGYLANLCLRTANRILMRIKSFNASNFRALEKNLNDFPWELYLRPDRPPRIQVTAHRSRLRHSGAIAERFLSGISRRLSRMAIDSNTDNGKSREQALFVRVLDDTFTVSLDSTGENLYRRGLKKEVTAAPLRETLAAALLMLAEYTPPEPLVDPMCGSGAFALEAAMQARRIPAGWFRNFAFSGWPVFSLTKKRWDFIRKDIQQNVVDADTTAVLAADIDQRACDALENNSAAAGFSRTIRVESRDFFNMAPEEFFRSTGLVTINPPFGRRIGTLKQSDDMFGRLFKRLMNSWQGWKVGLVVPRQNLVRRAPFKIKSLPIRHGGLRIFLVAGRISN